MVQPAVGDSIDSLRDGRRVSKLFSSYAGALVRTLESDAACGITPGAWKSFFNADGLRLDPSLEPTGNTSLFRAMLIKAPGGRLKRFTLVGSTYSRWARQAAAAIATSESTRQLRVVSIGSSITPADADTIISSLTSLEMLHLTVYNSSPQDNNIWAPSSSSTLLKLELKRHQPEARGDPDVPHLLQHVAPLRIDMAGIAGCASLQSLHLDMPMVNMPHIASLRHLRELHLSPGSSHSLELQPLKQLPLLHTFTTSSNIYPHHWEILAAVASLQHLGVSSLLLLTSSPASGSITKLVAQEVRLDGPDDAVVLHSLAGNRGALNRLLPELQCLEMGNLHTSVFRQNFAALLAGHGKLRSLKQPLWFTRSDEREETRWPAAALSSMPCLEQLHLQGPGFLDGGGLLADMAGCRQLQRVAVQGGDQWEAKLEGPCSRQALEGLAAACAAGSCGLQVLDAPLLVAGLPGVAALLRAPGVQEVRALVEWDLAPVPAGLSAREHALVLYGELAQQLKAAGCEVVAQAQPVVRAGEKEQMHFEDFRAGVYARSWELRVGVGSSVLHASVVEMLPGVLRSQLQEFHDISCGKWPTPEVVED